MTGGLAWIGGVGQKVRIYAWVRRVMTGVSINDPLAFSIDVGQLRSP
jgi:hypothetical protein